MHFHAVNFIKITIGEQSYLKCILTKPINVYNTQKFKYMFSYFYFVTFFLLSRTSRNIGYNYITSKFDDITNIINVEGRTKMCKDKFGKEFKKSAMKTFYRLFRYFLYNWVI